MSVLDDAIWTIIEAPAGTSSSADSQNDRDNEKRTSDTPNAAADVATHRPRPVTPRRHARLSAPPNAPRPEQAIRRPSPRGPPPRIWSAKMGISTAYGIPAKLT